MGARERVCPEPVEAQSLSSDGRAGVELWHEPCHNARDMTERKRDLMMERSGSMKPTAAVVWGAPGGGRERSLFPMEQSGFASPVPRRVWGGSAPNSILPSKTLLNQSVKRVLPLWECLRWRGVPRRGFPKGKDLAGGGLALGLPPDLPTFVGTGSAGWAGDLNRWPKALLILFLIPVPLPRMATAMQLPSSP